MKIIADPIDRRLLMSGKGDFPITPRPFAAIGNELGIEETDVLQRLERMSRGGRIARVGATCAPNSVSASTLGRNSGAGRSDRCGSAVIGAEPGVNHSYQREDHWNLWFVVTGPDRASVDATLQRIEAGAQLPVLDLRLVRPFNVDLGFRMSEGSRHLPAAVSVRKFQRHAARRS